MEYSVGDTLRVDGDIYDVIGKIQYKNQKDGCYWFEYLLDAREFNTQRWLSIDDVYREYTLSKPAFNVSTFGYHKVDEGVEEVIAVWGEVDVEVGDTATFIEYEDVTEEKIISLETWDDGEEQSTGYYLDAHEINRYNGTSTTGAREDYSSSSSGARGNNKAWLPFVILFGFMGISIFGNVMSSIFAGMGSATAIADYLKSSGIYTYVTSITGKEEQKADVYSSYSTVEETAKNIITGIEGDTENVQQNTEDGDNSIAILTKKEYCLVYNSEDNQVLVQVSPRKFAYVSDATPYRSRQHTHRYYRRYYYSRGYTSDAGSFKKSTSSYGSYDDTPIDVNYSDSYNSYSDSIRQASINSRTSSGGGLSSGK